jgi:hypothetical protein
MAATFTWAGFGQMMGRLQRLADPDPIPLLEEWEEVIRRDNKRGILAGQDKDGNPLRPVTYRPKGPPKRATKRQRNNAGARGIFAGLGPSAAGLHNNLTSAEYRKLGGPPLAPRGPNSRVITNLATVHSTAPVNGQWFADGYWDEVVSTKGVAFLKYHFDGAGRLPKRDLRGVRPQGKREALRAMQDWARSLLRGT